MIRRTLTIRGVLLAVLVAVVLMGVLAACSSDDSGDPGFVHIEEGAQETALAQTEIALVTPTEPATPVPAMTAAPYVRPTDSPDIDSDTVITRVGSEDITLDAYRKRVRFERYRTLYPIMKLAEKYGTQELFDLTDENNWYVSSVFATLADSYSFGAQVHRVMVVESITEQEARRRGIEVNTARFDATVAEWLGLQVGDGGQMPPEFDARYDEFITGIESFAGMSEEEFRRVIRAQTLYTQLKFEMRQEADIDMNAASTVGVQMQDIIVQDENEARVIAARLRDGESLLEVASSLGYAPAGDQTSRVIRISDDTLPATLIDMIFKADQGAVIGPEFIVDGWYVGKVGNQVLDMMSPEDVNAKRDDYFLNWVENQMDDPAVVEDLEDWVLLTPQEPLPRDISPLMNDEYIILPEVTEIPPEMGGTEGESTPEAGAN